MTIKEQLNLSVLNLDGTHTIAKSGGESVVYQRRKKVKPTNSLPITDKDGIILSATGLVAGNHHDAFNLKGHLQRAFKQMKQLQIRGVYFNADKAFDSRAARKTCFNHGLIPTIAKNRRNRKGRKRGRKRPFNEEIH